MGLHYPKYLFLTYGTYESHWWTKGSDDHVENSSMIYCSPEDRAEVLQYSFAVSHISKISDVTFNRNKYSAYCYDAIIALAFALEAAFEGSK